MNSLEIYSVLEVLRTRTVNYFLVLRSLCNLLYVLTGARLSVADAHNIIL